MKQFDVFDHNNQQYVHDEFDYDTQQYVHNKMITYINSLSIAFNEIIFSCALVVFTNNFDGPILDI